VEQALAVMTYSNEADIVREAARRIERREAETGAEWPTKRSTRTET